MTMRAAPTTAPSDSTGPERGNEVQTRLAAAMRDALSRRQIPIARRLAEAAWRCSPREGELTVELARLRLAEDNVEGAFALIDSIASHTVESGFLRAMCLIRLDRTAEAHLQIASLLRAGCTDRRVRLLHAMLEADAGELASARAVLKERDRDADAHTAAVDPERQVFEMLLKQEQDGLNGGAARDQSSDLKNSSFAMMALDPERRAMLETILLSLGCSRTAACLNESLRESAVESLARDLRACPDLAEALATAQCRQLDPPSADILHRALRMILVAEPAPAARLFVAMAKMSTLIDSTIAGRAWLDRGLQVHPWSAPLRHIAAEMDGLESNRRESTTPLTTDQTMILARIGPQDHERTKGAEGQAA